MPKKLEDNQIEGVQRLLSLLNPDTLTKEDFTKNFKKVIDHVGEMKKKNLEDFKNISKALTEASKNAKNDTKNDFNTLKDSIDTLSKKSLTELKNSFEKKIKELDERMEDLRDGEDADEEIIVSQVVDRLKKEIKLPEVVNIEEDLPKMGNEIRDALELLQGEDRLDVSAIKGLRKLLRKLEDRITGIGSIYQQGGSSSGGKVVKALDLSASLNGSKRIFAIQTVWRVISVHLTSSPTIMREGIDYTWTPTSITFTSEVSDISLSSGQSLILVVAE